MGKTERGTAREVFPNLKAGGQSHTEAIICEHGAQVRNLRGGTPMNNTLKLTAIKLNLFEGEGGAVGAGENGTQGENTSTVPGTTRRGKSGEIQNVVYGKRADTAAAPAAGEANTQIEDKAAKFREMINGEFKDIYTKETQRLIDRRFKETKQLEQQVAKHQPIIDTLMQRYHIEDGDTDKLAQALDSDTAYWESAADEAGMTVEQYRRMQELQRKNAELLKEQKERQGQDRVQRQLAKWQGEADEMKTLYPNFELQNELQNPSFLSLLRAGTDMKTAFEVIHMEDIKAGIAKQQAAATEKQIVAGIRAKGARPLENGTQGQSGFILKDDVSKLTKEDRAEVARRAARGEIISF